MTYHPVYSSTSNFKKIKYVSSCKRRAGQRAAKVQRGTFACRSLVEGSLTLEGKFVSAKRTSEVLKFKCLLGTQVNIA